MHIILRAQWRISNTLITPWDLISASAASAAHAHPLATEYARTHSSMRELKCLVWGEKNRGAPVSASQINGLWNLLHETQIFFSTLPASNYTCFFDSVEGGCFRQKNRKHIYPLKTKRWLNSQELCQRTFAFRWFWRIQNTCKLFNWERGEMIPNSIQ